MVAPAWGSEARGRYREQWLILGNTDLSASSGTPCNLSCSRLARDAGPSDFPVRALFALAKLVVDQLNQCRQSVDFIDP